MKETLLNLDFDLVDIVYILSIYHTSPRIPYVPTYMNFGQLEGNRLGQMTLESGLTPE